MRPAICQTQYTCRGEGRCDTSRNRARRTRVGRSCACHQRTSEDPASRHCNLPVDKERPATASPIRNATVMVSLLCLSAEHGNPFGIRPSNLSPHFGGETRIADRRCELRLSTAPKAARSVARSVAITAERRGLRSIQQLLFGSRAYFFLGAVRTPDKVSVTRVSWASSIPPETALSGHRYRDAEARESKAEIRDTHIRECMCDSSVQV